METSTKLKKKETGTTTVGIVTTEGVVLAADSQASMGSLVSNKEMMKVEKIWDHLGLTIAGLVGDANILTRFLRAKVRTHYFEYGNELDTESLATFLGTLLNYSKFMPYYIQLILGGYVDGPKLYSLDGAGGISPEKTFTSTGSGSVYAYGVLEDHYKEGLSLDAAVEIAIKAVRASRERDVYSGGEAINVVTITKDGFKRVNKKVIEDICKRYKRRTLRP
ncbi:MAG: proteasome subunit beta [Candidatus Diapherotrites archaeon]|nr:proteasome subunit beta [Candidatus Diapherotrites archaeon]